MGHLFVRMSRGPSKITSRVKPCMERERKVEVDARLKLCALRGHEKGQYGVRHDAWSPCTVRLDQLHVEQRCISRVIQLGTKEAKNKRTFMHRFNFEKKLTFCVATLFPLVRMSCICERENRVYFENTVSHEVSHFGDFRPFSMHKMVQMMN